MVTKKSDPVVPWKSQKIWAMVIGVVLVAVLFAFKQTELALSTAALVSAFILGRGLERLGAGLILVAALSLGACDSAGVQVPATQCTRAVLEAAADIASSCWPQSERGTQACSSDRD
jgi:hypothetical protein